MKKLQLSVLFVFSLALLQAQSTYTIDTENPVKVSVKGNSTLHEWEAVASEIIDYPKEINLTLNGPTGLEKFSFKVGVESLDGGRGASMNKKINKALISTDHPYIVFHASSVEAIPSSEENYNKIKTIGELEIAGKKKEVEIMAEAKLADGQLILSGSKDLKMSDFDIEPPTAMFGQIKTRDDISVHFEFKYIADQQ